MEFQGYTVRPSLERNNPTNKVSMMIINYKNVIREIKTKDS